jgi:transposase-like protein
MTAGARLAFGRVSSLVEKRSGAFFRLVKCTTNAPPCRGGHPNGLRERTLTGPTGPVVLTLPRATLFSGVGDVKEWTSRIVPRYQRRIPEVNEAVIATYLAGGNTRRIRGALQPLLKAALLSKSAVSRVIATLKGGLEAWRTRSLTDLDVIYVYLDGFALRVRSGGKVVCVPVLVAA